MDTIALRSTLNAVKSLLVKTQGKQHLGLPLSKTERVMAESIHAYAPHLETWSVDKSLLARMAVRDYHFQSVLVGRQADFDTLVLLGCGYSAVDDVLAGKTIIHVDGADVLEKKKRLYSQERISAQNEVHFIPADINRLPLDRLPVAGRVVLCMEGITYYLEPATVEGIFAYAGRAGAMAMFDYFTASTLGGNSPFAGVNELVATLHSEGTPIRWVADPPQIEECAARSGLNVQYNRPIGEIMEPYGLSQDPWVYFAILGPHAGNP